MAHIVEQQDNVSVPNRPSKPQPRSGHVAVVFGNEMLIWGGYADYVDDLSPEERYHNPYIVWVYQSELDKWIRRRTDGDVPPGTSGACAVAVDNYMYIIGGHTDHGNTSAVYRLNVCDWEWEAITVSPDEPQPSPRDKFVAWHYNNKIFVFAGFGTPPEHANHCYSKETGEFFWDSTTLSRGWNNQVWMLDLSTQRWTITHCKGKYPNPRAACAAALIGDNLYLFGGRHDMTRMNDLHCLHLPTLIWSGNLLVAGVLPCGRSWHTLTAISNRHIFLFGGFSHESVPCNDGWLLDVHSLQWQQLPLPEYIMPHLWHTACLTQLGDVLVFGGCSNNILSIEEESLHTNDLLIFRCSAKSLKRLCLDRVFELRDLLESEWDTLPRPLYQILTTRAQGQKTIKEEEISHETRLCVIS